MTSIEKHFQDVFHPIASDPKNCVRLDTFIGRDTLKVEIATTPLPSLAPPRGRAFANNVFLTLYNALQEFRLVKEPEIVFVARDDDEDSEYMYQDAIVNIGVDNTVYIYTRKYDTECKVLYDQMSLDSWKSMGGPLYLMDINHLSATIVV